MTPQDRRTEHVLRCVSSHFLPKTFLLLSTAVLLVCSNMASRSKVRAFFPENEEKGDWIRDSPWPQALQQLQAEGATGKTASFAPPATNLPWRSPPRAAGPKQATPAPQSSARQSPAHIATHRSLRSPWWPPAPGRVPPASQRLQGDGKEKDGGQLGARGGRGRARPALPQRSPPSAAGSMLRPPRNHNRRRQEAARDARGGPSAGTASRGHTPTRAPLPATRNGAQRDAGRDAQSSC